MTTRFKTYVAAGAAVLTLAAGAPMLLAQNEQPQRRGPGFGGPPPGGPGGPGMRMRGPGGPGFGFRGLDLTDDQQEQLKRIAESHRDEVRAAGEKVRAAHQAMRALTDADTIDEAAIRAKSAEIGAANAEMMILQAKIRKESMQVLTSEQLAKLKERREAGPGQRGPRQRRPQQ
jgi:Spy/CpxP family protein refolding chaperone